MNGYEQSSVPHQDFINSYKNNYYTNNYVQNIKNWYDYAAGQRCYNESGYQEFNKEQLGNYYGGNKKQEQTFDATQSNFVKSPLPASVYPEHEPCSKVQPGTSYVSGYTPNATYDRPLKEFELENRTSCINNFELSPPQRYHTPLSCDPNLLNGKNIAIEASLCLQNIVSAQISGQNIAEVQNLATLQEGANAQIVRSDKDISSIVLPRVNHITKTQNIKNVSDVQKDTINEVPSKNSEAKFPKLRELLSKPKNEKVVSPYCNITPINYKSQHKNIAQRELMELLEFDDLAPWIEKGKHYILLYNHEISLSKFFHFVIFINCLLLFYNVLIFISFFFQVRLNEQEKRTVKNKHYN